MTETKRRLKVFLCHAQSDADRKKRTFTNLYNAGPTWLDLTHKRLDEAVFAAYGWQSHPSDEEILEKLLALNLERVRQANRQIEGYTLHKLIFCRF